MVTGSLVSPQMITLGLVPVTLVAHELIMRKGTTAEVAKMSLIFMPQISKN